MSDNERRFSLDPINVDPSLLNKIFSADGDETVGEWNGEDINDLVKELDRIEERVDANYNSLPHSKNIPEDLKGDVEKDCSIWTCDIKGNCLTGEQGADIESADQIRKRYTLKYGSMEAFKEKVRIEREKFVAEIKSRSKLK
jgi:hypothetical protein